LCSSATPRSLPAPTAPQTLFARDERLLQRVGARNFPLPLQRVHIRMLFGESPVIPVPRQFGQVSSSTAVSIRRPFGILSIPIALFLRFRSLRVACVERFKCTSEPYYHRSGCIGHFAPLFFLLGSGHPGSGGLVWAFFSGDIAVVWTFSRNPAVPSASLGARATSNSFV
jgi:hypothetical protein